MKYCAILLGSFSLLCGDQVEELKEDVCDILPDVDGWCSEEKALNFIDLVLEVKPNLCVEIGVFAGASLIPVASALKYLGHGMIIAIDPWDKVECIRYLDPDKDRKDLQWWGDIRIDHIYFAYLNNLRRYELDKVCLTLRATSEKVAPLIGAIDILYIDGNHYEDIVKRDVELYGSKVRPGGYIWLNDAKWPGMKAAVELLEQSCDVVKSIENGSCVLFQKR
ncbi:MAG TPA: class I SAM-dependent methyltransferase [Chlamydiales bacterium]|nr:class I SAM-dependent methyltransferase [Chlamydiales bacterium]